MGKAMCECETKGDVGPLRPAAECRTCSNIGGGERAALLRKNSRKRAHEDQQSVLAMTRPQPIFKPKP